MKMRFQDEAIRHDGIDSVRRRMLAGIVGVGFMPLLACGQGEKQMQKSVVFNVVMYSNLDRPIHDIIFNGVDLGVANSYGSTGTITGVRVPLGRQTFSWTLGGPEGMPRNGEKVLVKNQLIILSAQIPADTRYLGLHLYPDDTAEITFDEFIPERSARGKQIRANRK